MAETHDKALTVARAYFDAMANKNVEKIISLSAVDVVCRSPRGQLDGAQAFHGFQEGFAKMIKKLTLVAAFGDGEHAVIIYETETHPVPRALVAEYITVKNGKIASTDVIYDAMPFAAYVATVQPH